MARESTAFFHSFANVRKFSSNVLDYRPSKSNILEFHSKKQWRSYFDSSKLTNKLLVIDFTATWCGPCKTMDPAVKEFAAKYTDVEFIKMDVDELEQVAEGYGVQTLPVFILIKGGKEVDKVVGARKDELRIKIEKHRI